MARTRVLILGGGFAGVYAAMRLDRTLARDPDVEVTLVNRDNFFLFTPMLHEVASSDLDLTHIVNPIRKLLRRVKFFAGEARSIDLTNRRAVLVHGYADGEHAHEVEFDHLVLALGSVTNFFNLPGLAERAIPMKSLGDAIDLRNRVVKNLEEADFECCPNVRRRLTTFVVAGGGFAGVETIGAMNDFVRQAKQYYPSLPADSLRLILVHPGNVVLPELGPKLGGYAQKCLAKRGVEIRSGTRVLSADAHGVTLSDGERIETNTIVWTAGTAPNPLLATLPCHKDRGRVIANEFLEVPEWPGVWAVGDSAAVPDPATGGTCPPTAQHASRQGDVVARNIEAAVRGGTKKPFRFKTLGLLAAIGRRTGVAEVLGFRFSGFVAWFMWRSIYLMKLPRWEKRVRVAIDWTLDLFFAKDLTQFQTAPPQPAAVEGRVRQTA